MTRIFLFAVLSWASVSVQGQAVNPKRPIPRFRCNWLHTKARSDAIWLKIDHGRVSRLYVGRG